MRDIKFRAWDEESMRYIESFDLMGLRFITSVFRDPVNDNLVVEQFTGLKDKNGKEIYEGDINTHGYVVRYVADCDESYEMNAGWYLERGDFESWVELECNEEHNIIGNIHENKELLK